jgi:hypothetical protein
MPHGPLKSAITGLSDKKTDLISMSLLPSNLSCVPSEKELGINKSYINVINAIMLLAVLKKKKDHNSKFHPKIKIKEKKVYECQVEGCFKKVTTRNGLKYHKKTQYKIKLTL